MISRRLSLLATVAVTATVAAIAALTPPAARAIPPSGIVRPTTEPAEPSVELGSQLYAGNCASCHGIAGSGITDPRPGAGNISGAGPPLHGVGAQAPDFYLRTGYMPLSNYHDEPMNGRPLFSDKEIRSLVAYVAGLGTGPAIPHPDPAAGSTDTGFQLFDLHCAGCHQIDARGGFVTGGRVPPLQGSITARQVAEAVRIGPYLMPSFPKSQISDVQLNSIAKYVIYMRHPPNRGGWGIGNIGPIPEGLVAWWIAVPVLLICCAVVSRRYKRS